MLFLPNQCTVATQKELATSGFRIILRVEGYIYGFRVVCPKYRDAQLIKLMKYERKHNGG